MWTCTCPPAPMKVSGPWLRSQRGSRGEREHKRGERCVAGAGHVVHFARGGRNRFHDLLSEIGENVVVLLSTHIVDDVSDLCTRMAVLAGGRVLVQGKPTDLMKQLDGRVWRRTVRKDAVPQYRDKFTVLSARLFAGETRIHVLADARPEEGFEPIAPDLEDVYFSVLR